MNSRVNFKQEQLFWSSAWGVGRGLCVHTLIYPLEVIKIRLQCSNGGSSVQVASALLKQEGVSALYKGLAPQLLKTSIKQVWCWPMITATPIFLQKYRIGNLGQQALTGLAIATVDAAISTPLERAKITSAYRGKSEFSLKNIYKGGWQGFGAHWSKLSVNWMTFLMVQKYLRDRYDKASKEPLSFSQLAEIGVQVALVVSVASAPFDLANTLKQAQNRSLSHLFSLQGIFKSYRAAPINAAALVIHNIASVYVIHKLSNFETRAV